MKRNRVYLAFISTLFTSILFIMSSYAWLSTNNIISSETFNIHIASKGGLQVSVDGINWKGVVTLFDITEARRTYSNSRNQIPLRIEPVSTIGETENGLLKMFHGTVIQDEQTLDNYITAERSIETEGFGENSNGKFVAFDLFFKSNYRQSLSLDKESKMLSKNAENTGIENAFRVAFLNEGTLPVASQASNVQRLSNATKAYIWEPNYDVHTDYALDNARLLYNVNTTKTNGSLIPYYGLSKPIEQTRRVLINETYLTKNSDIFKRVNPDIATTKAFPSEVELFILTPGITKVRLYIWIEGQDVDCENNASLADALINLQLNSRFISER